MSLKKKTGLQRRQFTKEFKLKILAELDGGIGMAQVARKYQVHPTLSANGENNPVNIKTALLQAGAKPIPMKPGSPSSNVWHRDKTCNSRQPRMKQESRRFSGGSVKAPQTGQQNLLTFDLQLTFTLSRDVILRLNKQIS
jgi:hypothetical protein